MELSDLVEKAKYHAADSLGFIVVSMPLGTLIENVIAGMDDEISMKSRAAVAALYVCGFGRGLGYVRDKSKQLFKIVKETKGRYKHLHDMVYVGVTTLIFNPLIYLAAGSRDFDEIAMGTLVSVGGGALFGGVMGYSVDAYREFFGVKRSGRLPSSISNASNKKRCAVATGVLALSLGICSMMYSLTPDEPKEFPVPMNYAETLDAKIVQYDSTAVAVSDF